MHPQKNGPARLAPDRWSRNDNFDADCPLAALPRISRPHDGDHMSLFRSAYEEQQHRRFMRPNAHLFIRSDWRRYVSSGHEGELLFSLYERKYRADQPRVPAGSADGGQWTDGSAEGLRSENSRQHRAVGTEELSAASRKGGHGHHYVPSAEIRNRGVSSEATKVFENAKTGALYDPRSNKWDKDHRVYNKAVGEALDGYLVEMGTSPEKMTADQAREFLGRIVKSRDPRIRSYNMRIQMREIMQRVLRRGGRE